ncbi:MAG TPA: pyrimidine-nucleoside phosphorylase [Phaeodactylibacter sp.]|nr:pyrimidine-nucleoside phosphorylase [Phaeodactylibacter sp.]
MTELIQKKKDGKALTKKELQSFIKGFVSGRIPDYQAAAFLMAVYFQGMNNRETTALTEHMMYSGEVIDLSSIKGIKVDKHSTGGVGDKTTIVLAPLVAAAGIPLAKMSGRGLGHTGGTLDKLESIKGLYTSMSKEEFLEKVKKHGIAICAQNKDLVPADKKLYALRDVTATVDNISLIASSIMSKKLACGADAIVMDIKVGEGAFIKNIPQAKTLAKLMMDIGLRMNRQVMAVLSDMQQPLGFAVGNAIEVNEAIDTLRGNGPEDLTELCLELGSHMLLLAGKAKNKQQALRTLKQLIQSGKALRKFKTFIAAQGGDSSFIDQAHKLPQSPFSQILKSKKSGYISHLNALEVGLASAQLGAGRLTKESSIDYGAGILLKKKIGDKVRKGESLAILYSSQQSLFKKAIPHLEKAFTIGKSKIKAPPLIIKAISNDKK